MKCTEEMYQACKQVLYAPESQNETVRDLIMNGIEAAIDASHMAEVLEVKNGMLQVAVKLFDQLLPQIGKVSIDVGLLNEFLVRARHGD